MTEKKLFLLDAYALIFRAYYAFIKNPRFNSKGLNTSAILGFTNTLDEIIKKEKPTHLAVVFDYPAQNFRNKLFPAYKAQRPPTPEDIKKSVPYIKEIIKGYNIPFLEIEGFEADDVIGSIAKTAEKADFKVYMMTPDKDFIQLVSDNIFIYRPKRSGKEIEIVDLKYIKNTFGLTDPLKFIEILALWGDTADNVPGVRNIGEKTAQKLINDYGSIEGIYQNLSKLSTKQKENLLAGKEQLALSKELVTIKVDIDIDFNEEYFKLKPYNKQKLTELFEELEFKAASLRILDSQPQQEQPKVVQGLLFGAEQIVEEVKNYQTIENIKTNYLHLIDKEQRLNLIKKLATLSEFCFDTETTGLEAYDCEIVGLSISYKKNEAYFISFPQNQTETKKLLNEFKEIFENENILKIGQNLKFDIIVLKQYGIEVKGKLFDTMIAHYLLEPELKHNMDYLAEIYLNYKPIPIENLIGTKGKNQGNMRSVADDKIVNYACEDADVTYQLASILSPKLKENGLAKLSEEIEMPLVYVLADMEFTGVTIDSNFLNNYQKVLVEIILKKEDEIKKMAGYDFNVSSPKQLGEILFDRMKIIPNPKKTKTAQYSTSEEELMKISDKHDIIKKVLEYRSLKKLLNTYIEVLPTLVNKKTNKIHTSYNQAIASTGRLTSNNPNLQNIPIRTEEGKEIRKAFIPSDENHILIDAVYSQIELRLIAHLSQDQNMITAFKNKEDIHTATAAKIFKIPLNEVTTEMRYKAKSANFAIIYGASAFGLSTNLSISRSDAKFLIDGYFETYPKVKEYMDNSIKLGRENEYVVTIKGRKRHLADINSRNSLVRGNAERNAINAPIQGSAADIIKIAMINIFKRIEKENLKSKMIMQVHDELLIDTYKPELEIVKNIISDEMQNAIQLSVPLTIDIKSGKNWFEAH
jgi:DNA polymerase-1